jgi:hypothetical protein
MSNEMDEYTMRYLLTNSIQKTDALIACVEDLVQHMKDVKRMVSAGPSNGIEEAVKAEREACANMIADDTEERWRASGHPNTREAMREIMAVDRLVTMIRARGEK